MALRSIYVPAGRRASIGWSHQRGGFYHDGRFATLRDVVEHYNDHFNLQLNEREIADLIEYLKSI
jgi:cytochrome c peroxidase